MDIPMPRTLENAPVELQNMVFSFLDSGTLASLCLVSQRINAVAKCMLYEQLVLPFSTFEDIDRVHTLLVVRAASKIRDHTQGLTIIDVSAPDEAISARGTARKVYTRRTPRSGSVTNAEKDQSLYLLMSLVPSGRLHTFRHLSSRPLSLRILEYLSYQQRGLVFLQATIRHDPQYRPRFMEWFQVSHVLTNLPRIRTCDINFIRSDQFHQFIRYLLSKPFGFPSHLRNLRICVPEPYPFSQIFKEEALDSKLSSLNLKCLALDGFDMGNLFESVSQLTQIQSLTSLALWDCLHTDLFFFELTSVFLKSPRLIDLRHLTTNFTYIDQQNIDICLQNVFKICRLNSVHIVWENPRGQPVTTMEAMPVLAKSLRSLSFHQKSLVHLAEEELPYIQNGLDTLIGPCCHLYQLGLQVNEYYILPQVWDTPILRGHIKFWSALRSTPYLTILHLRQYELCQHPQPRSEKDVAWDLERFASGLFAFLDKEQYCPRLRCLVIGMRQFPVFNRASGRIPRHYFLKAKQQVGFNTETVVAVSVTLSQLQKEGLDETILDYDPGCEWQGGRPGQFHIK